MSLAKRSLPPTGLPVGVEPGPLGKRFVAQLIDAVVPAVIGVVGAAVILQVGEGTSAALTTSIISWVLALAWFVLVWWMAGTRAASPGMRAMKLQLVGLRNGRPIGWGRYLGRSLLLALLTATVVGLLVMLALLVRHRRRQGWHDLAVDSVVIKQRPLPPARPARAAGQQRTDSARPTAAVSGATTRAPESVSPPPGRPVAAGAPLESPLGPADSVRMRPGHATSRPPATQVIPPVPDDGRPLDKGWVAVLDDGREIEISGLVLLGRNPQARPGEEDAELIKVADETRTVSKTHLALGVDASGLYVMDRGSTNGTTLTRVATGSRPCPAGDVVPAAEGIVSFGDHWLRIERRLEDR